MSSKAPHNNEERIERNEDIELRKEDFNNKTMPSKETMNSMNDIAGYESENPLLREDEDSDNEYTMKQMTIDEVNANEFEKVLDSEMSQGQIFDVTVGDDEEVIPMNDNISLDALNAEIFETKEEAKDTKKDEKKNVIKNTSEPFGLFKAIKER